MKTTTPADVAAMLKGLRAVFGEHQKASGLRVQYPPMVAAEALLWIAAGVDSATDLAQAMNTDKSTASRTIALLRGRARWKQGKQMQSPFGLIELRKHPHRRGYQLALTQDGQELLRCTFTAAFLQNCTSVEQT